LFDVRHEILSIRLVLGTAGRWQEKNTQHDTGPGCGTGCIKEKGKERGSAAEGRFDREWCRPLP
jgi:hypothetical protein